MILSGRSEKTNFYQYLLTKTSKIRQEIPEKVVKLQQKLNVCGCLQLDKTNWCQKDHVSVLLNPEYFPERFELNDDFYG